MSIFVIQKHDWDGRAEMTEMLGYDGDEWHAQEAARKLNRAARQYATPVGRRPVFDAVAVEQFTMKLVLELVDADRRAEEELLERKMRQHREFAERSKAAQRLLNSCIDGMQQPG